MKTRALLLGLALPLAACANVLGVESVSYSLPIAPDAAPEPFVVPQDGPVEASDAGSLVEASLHEDSASLRQDGAAQVRGTCACDGKACPAWKDDTGGPDKIDCGGSRPLTCTNPDTVVTGGCHLSGHDHLYFYYWYCCS